MGPDGRAGGCAPRADRAADEREGDHPRCRRVGTVVGYELGKLGYDFRILEARDRVGGLNWTVRRGTEHTEIGGGERQVCTFDEGLYVNVGRGGFRTRTPAC